MNKTWFACLAGVAVLLGSLQAQAEGDIRTGQIDAYTCSGCHGIPGYMNAYPSYHVPKLGGQNDTYLISALNDYRNGNRSHPTMVAQASSLDATMINDIAAYFVSLRSHESAGNKFNPLDGDPVEGEKKSLACQACHGTDGNGVDPQYPRLAGQYADYLAHAMRAYQKGDRNNVIMVGMMSALSEEDINDLAAFYATKEGLIDLTIK